MQIDTNESGPAVQLAIAEAWRRRAIELAAWVLLLLVNRTDVHGGYYVDGGRVKPTTRHVGLTTARLTVHFAADGTDDVCGVHVTGPDETSRWCVVDIDAHAGDDSDPAANFRFALHVLERARAIGLSALLFDSNGAGGYHIWLLFDRPFPTATVWRLGKYLVRDHAAFGLVKAPESFPKAPALSGKRKGLWVRLPGLHHKRPHWTRVWDGERWLEGDAAVDAILATRGGDVDPASVVPDDFDPRPTRGRRDAQGRGQRTTRPAVNTLARAAADATPPRASGTGPTSRDVALARRALSHLGPAYRDDYDEWLRVGMSLRQLGDAGLALWHDWSSTSPKYVADVLDAKWDGFADASGSGRLTLGTLFHMAGMEGWVGPASTTRRNTVRFAIPTFKVGSAREAKG